MARQSNEEFQQEVRELVIEISKLFSQRYPKGTKEYAFHMLSALATIIANILADLNEANLEDAIIKQIQYTTKSIRQRKEDGEGPDVTMKKPDIN